MPSISSLITGLGCTKGAGPNFYLPADHPHVHIGVTNAALTVPNLAGTRQYIAFISLSYGNGVNTVNLYRRGVGEHLEEGTYNINKKTRFEAALYSQIGINAGTMMQKMLNELTGMGIDI
jgi:hypothetical protein